MSEKRTGLGRGLDALLPGRQVSRQPSAIGHQQGQKQQLGDAQSRNGIAQDSDGGASRQHSSVPTISPNAGDKDGAQAVSNGAIGANGAAAANAGSAAAIADKDALAGAKVIPLDAIERNPYQTRGKVDEAALAELTASIREQGVLQPILVRVIGHRSSVVGTDGRQSLAVSHQQNQNLNGATPSDSATSSDSGGGASRGVHSGSQSQKPFNTESTKFTETTKGIGGNQSQNQDQAHRAIRYQLMAGERRWTAAQRAGLKVIPAIVMQASNEQAMEITIIENLQREDLNPMEQARAFERLSREFALTQDVIAAKTGKDRASVSNFMRLLKLPAGVQQHLEAGTLSLGHGKVLMMLQNEPPEMVERVAAKAAEQGTSVRELEELVLALMGPPKDTLKQNAARRDPNVVAAERELQSALGCKVKITDRMGKGKIVLEYATLEDFDRILEVLSAK